MLIDNVDNFALWLSDELSVLCEADPVTLSKYVIALLKKDKSENSLKKICVEQLSVFLLEKTKDFVTKVFECLKNKEYLPVNEVDSNRMDITCDDYIVLTKPINDNTIIEDCANIIKIEEHNDNISNEKKCSPKNNDNGDTDDEKRILESKSYVKRHLDYASHKNIDEFSKKRRFNDDVDLRDRKRYSSRHKSHKSKKHLFDRIDQKNLDRNESKLITFSSDKRSWEIKTSCPDFVEKGVCLKGDSCEFDHGTNIVRSDINCIYSAPGINQANVNPNWQPLQMSSTWVGNYSMSKHNQNLVDLKKIDDNTYQLDSKQNVSSHNQSADIYDPSHPELDAINDTDSRNGFNDQNPVYVPSTVDSGGKDGAWWKEVDAASASNCTEVSQVTTVIGRALSRSRRTMSPVKRGRYNNNQGDTNVTSNNYKNNFNRNNYHNDGNNNYNRINENNNRNHFHSDNNNYNKNNNHNDNNNRNNYHSDNNNNNKKFNNARVANARCLLVTHIPIDCNEDKKLRQHFRTFGTITDLEVRFQNDAHHALIEFATCDEAKEAFRSPIPILDNRFIRTSLFNRPNDFQNLKLCKNCDNQSESKYTRKVLQQNSPKKDDDNDVVEKWPENSQSSDDEQRPVLVKPQPVVIERKSNHWPVASELKLDRRSCATMAEHEDGKIKDKSVDILSRPLAFKRDERNPKLIEAQLQRHKKIKAINDRKELKERVEKLEESVEGCKNRLRTLLAEQNNPDCDKDLIKRQLLESYNYFKELRDLLESLKKKLGPQAQISETDKLKIKIKNIQTQLLDMDKESDGYKNHLKMITEYKRNLVKLQTITKSVRPNRLPSIGETKLDNRPKTLYVTGLYATNTFADVKQYFKKYQIEKIESSDNDIDFFAVEFKTRKEADTVLFEMGKDKKVSLSYDKPIQICDPFNFSTTRIDHPDAQRGTPRDNCVSSDDDDEEQMKMN